MRAFLDKIYRFGLTESLSTYDAFKLQILNRLAVFCLGILAILVTINITFQNYVGILIDLSAALLFLIPILVLNKHRYYNFATNLFLIGFHLTLIVGTYHTILEGRQSGVEYLFIPAAIALIILLNTRFQYVAVVVNFALLTALNYLRFAHYGAGDMEVYFRLTFILFAVYLLVFQLLLSLSHQMKEGLRQHLLQATFLW